MHVGRGSGRRPSPACYRRPGCASSDSLVRRRCRQRLMLMRPWWLRRRRWLTPDEKFRRRYLLFRTIFPVDFLLTLFFPFTATVNNVPVDVFFLLFFCTFFTFIAGYISLLEWMRMRRQRRARDEVVATLMKDFERRWRWHQRHWSLPVLSNSPVKILRFIDQLPAPGATVGRCQHITQRKATTSCSRA